MALVVLTRLAVTYDLLPLEAIETVVRLAHDKGTLVYVDDAGGARVGPAAFGQPRMLELGVDLGATGLDKYGTKGPRLGLLAGRKDLVGRIRVKGFEFGMEARQMLYPAVARTLEQYDPARVRSLIATTKQIGDALQPLLGNRLRETPTTIQIAAEDILEIAMERGGIREPTVVPYEASAALSMLLLRDYGMLMVHFVGVPPGDGRSAGQIRATGNPRALWRGREICGGRQWLTDPPRRIAPRSGEHSQAAAGEVVAALE